MPVIRKADVTPVTGTGYPAPYDAGMGRYQAWPLSDAGGLTQFGAFIETLEPGGASSHRHWHEKEDEFLYMLEGEITVIENDGAQVIGPGDACCWKAGEPIAHRLENRSDAPATYLVVGTRADTCHYADIDLVYTRRDGKAIFSCRDGRVLKERNL